MNTSAEQIRSYSGPAILSYGFRPLFLSAGIWAATVMALWLAMLSGSLALPTSLGPVDWHVHELLFGYLPAVVAGFLLTAVPNWTGRLPMTGRPLLLLALIWWAGRFAVLFSEQLGPTIAATVDLAFLATLGFLVAREIVAGRNWRNLKVLVPVSLLFCGNALFHVEAANGHAYSGNGTRLGIASAVFLIMLIGGRIVPSFTRNWLARREAGRLPVPFNRYDIFALAVGGLALAAWVVSPESGTTALFCLLAGALHIWRLVRWAPERTLAEPLVWILHAGYAFVSVGFILLGVSRLSADVIVPSAALHAWTAGAVGVMTLAVMTRASLGHTGYPLQATPGVTAIYAFALASAVVRIVAGTGMTTLVLLDLAGALWIAAFVSFVAVFGPSLCRRGP